MMPSIKCCYNRLLICVLSLNKFFFTVDRFSENLLRQRTVRGESISKTYDPQNHKSNVLSTHSRGRNLKIHSTSIRSKQNPPYTRGRRHSQRSTTHQLHGRYAYDEDFK